MLKTIIINSNYNICIDNFKSYLNTDYADFNEHIIFLSPGGARKMIMRITPERSEWGKKITQIFVVLCAFF